MVVIALVVGKIGNGVNRTDRITADLIHGAVNSGNACHMTAVIMNGFNGALCGKAGGDGCHQNQNSLALNHGLDVITENDLGVCIIFGLYNIDGLMGIDGVEAGLGQFLGNTGTQNGSAVQTQDGINGCIINEMGNQLVSGSLGFAQTSLLLGNIDVVIDVGVVCCEMTAGNAQGNL